MFVYATVIALAGLILTAVGVLGRLERLPRNRFAGIRTAATMRSEESFRLANKVAGLPTMVGGLIGVATAVVTMLGATQQLVIIGLTGLLAIAIAGGVLGHRAAEAMPEPKPASCAGCACGTSVCANVAGMGGK